MPSCKFIPLIIPDFFMNAFKAHTYLLYKFDMKDWKTKETYN